MDGASLLTYIAERVVEVPNESLGTPCLVWTRAKSKGYGHFGKDGRDYYAHRVMYEHKHGQVPEGKELDHLCRVRACVNPEHLEPVTRAVNTMRGARRTDVTMCPQGHPYQGDNLYLKPNGKRECRTCKREQLRAWRASRR